MLTTTSTWKLANRHWQDKMGVRFTGTVTLTFVDGRDRALMMFTTWATGKPADPKARCLAIDAKTTSAAEVARIAREGLQKIVDGAWPFEAPGLAELAG